MTAGKLLLVATPIGNLGDMSTRGAAALGSADVIACEDTRHTRKLLNHLGIRGVPVIAVHEHNEMARTGSIVERVRNGETVALVTDAGMPAISDPGSLVVAAVADAGLQVSVIPGASAVVAALAISGLPTERFVFEGFLPLKATERKQRVADVSAEARTTVLYEAPHRLAKTVGELASACGDDRRVALVRELTKVYEEVWRGTLGELSARLGGNPVKGECVLVLAGVPNLAVEVSDEEIEAAVETAVAGGMTKRDAVAAVAAGSRVPKNRVYGVANSAKPPAVALPRARGPQVPKR